MTRGKFICLEGIDFSGKSNQTRRLLEYLKTLDTPVTTARDPGATSFGEVQRLILKEPERFYTVFNAVFSDYKGFPEGGIDPLQKRTPFSETLVYIAARADLVNHIILPVLEQGGNYVGDRFKMSTDTYQGAGRYRNDPEMLDLIDRMSKVANQGLEPDLTFLLDIPHEVMVERSPKVLDEIESEVEDFWHRVIAKYRELAKTDPKVITIDGTLDKEVIFNEFIRPEVDRLLKRQTYGP